MNKNQSLIGFMLLLISGMGNAQSDSSIPAKDYHLWVQIQEEKLAPDGKWIAFHTRHQENKDTLFLYSTAKKNVQKFANGEKAAFSPDANWFTFNEKDQLMLINLKSNHSKKIPSVAKIAYGQSGMIGILSTDKKLLLYTPNDTNPQVVEKVEDFSYNANGVLALISENTIKIFDAASMKSTFKVETKKASKLQWDSTGKVLYYFDQLHDGQTTLVAFDSRNKSTKKITTTALAALDILVLSERRILPALEENKCFFYAKTNTPVKPTDDALVQIWDATTPLHYPAQKELEVMPNSPKIYCWDMAHSKVKQLTVDSLFTVKILPNKKELLAYYPIHVGQLQRHDPIADYYSSTIGTGNYKLLLKAQSTAVNAVMPSPDGRYLGYLNEKGWNHYDGKTKTHILVLNLQFITENTSSVEAECTSLGWTTDSKYCVISLGKELWLIGSKGKEKIKITETDDTNTSFRIAKVMHKSSINFINEEIGYLHMDIKKGIYLQAYYPDKSMGFYKWTKENGLKLLYKSPGKILITAKDNNNTTVILKEETDVKPPAIVQLNLNTNKSFEVYQSNMQYKRYAAPRVELLEYNDAEGRPLNALLHYPINYNSTKKYPMIVYVYEMLSQNRFEYNAPSNYSFTGFSVANYTNDGYFVLQPDIKYTIGDPGTSIVNAIDKGVQHALKSANIDADKIGLIGHSYGGHEAALTISKTKIFAAAVAGAASTNMISDYLSLNEQTNGIKFWKFEVQQYRMGSAPFYNWEAYAKNSPVMNAEHITTPLLSWTGSADGTVDWRQSIELHLALKRLQKKNILLVYPNEGHILTNPEAQKDLTKRIKKWFDDWLK
jgi:dipeptidyl aminopeptidase/acylaminoacyl peptidase